MMKNYQYNFFRYRIYQNSNFKGTLMYEITLIRHMLLKSPANIVELKKVVKTLVVFRRK